MFYDARYTEQRDIIGIYLVYARYMPDIFINLAIQYSAEICALSILDMIIELINSVSDFDSELSSFISISS